MKKYLKYLIIIGLLGILTFAAFPLRNYYLFLKEPVAPLTDAIPIQTAILIRSWSLNRFIEVLRASELFNLLERNKTRPDMLAMADKVAKITRNNSFFNEIATQNEIIICLIPGEDLNPELLFLAAIGKTSPANVLKQLESVLNEDVKIKKTNHSPEDLYSIKTKDLEIWFYVNKGILALAFDRQTIEQSCNAMVKENNLTKDRAFLRLAETSGKRVDGVMMINNKKLIESLLQIKENNPLDFNGSPFNGWTSLDLHLEKNRILMDGFTVGLNDTTIITGQEPGGIQNLELLPSGAALAITLTISNQQAYTSCFTSKDTLHLTGYDSANQTASMEIFRREEHLRSWVGKTVSFAAMPDYFKGDKSAVVALIELKNADSAARLLKPYLQPYKGEINIFTASNLPERLWGSLFTLRGQQYCLLTSQVLIISPSPQLLESYSHETAENRLFGTSSSYKAASALLLEKSNVSIIAIPSVCGQYFARQNRDKYSRISTKWTGLAASADLLCLQYNTGKPMIFTHAFALIKSGQNSQVIAEQINFNSSDTPEAGIQKDKLSEKPAALIKEKVKRNPGINRLLLIPDPKSGKNLILTFNKNIIQAYSQNGNILWSFKCTEEASGEVFRVGLKQKKGDFLLVVAGKYLHFIDLNGRELAESPVKLTAAADGNLAVFDYDRTKDYRLLFQGKDNYLYNISIDGKELHEWEKPKLNSSLSGPPQFFRTGAKDYILFADSKGNILINDRRGRQRIKVEEGVRKSNGSGVFENRTNSKGLFLMASQNGSLAYIDINGKSSESRFGDFGNNPWFDYLDFNGDGEKEFIFCGKGNIAVFTKMKKIIASASMVNAGFSKPHIYTSAHESWLVTRDTRSGKIVAFNNKNQSFSDKTIFSDIDPVIFFDEGKKKPVLLTALDGELIFTLLEK